MGISGPGPFRRIRLPEEGQGSQSEFQEKLVNLNATKQTILDELVRRPNPSAGDKEQAKIWEGILAAVGDYLGQAQKGLPPIVSEMTSAIEKVCTVADQLDDTIGDLNFHAEDTLYKAVRRQGGDLYELKTQLGKLIDADIIAKGMHDKAGYPMDLMRFPKNGLQSLSRGIGTKGYPDPYLKYLIERLHDIWSDAVGKPPSKTGTDNYNETRTSPFFDWCLQIAKATNLKPFPRELVDTVIDLNRSDG